MAGKADPADQNARNRKRRSRRRLRWWPKKRGSRQTGSSRWGSAGEALFFAALFVVGVLALTELLVLRISLDWQGFLATGWGLWLSVLMLASLIILGAVGAIYSVVLTGASPERRAALATRARNLDLLAESQSSRREFPNVPSATNWTNSPGIRLAYRLPIASSPAWRLLVVASFCLVWNGAVAVLAVLAFNAEAGVSWSFAGLVLFYASLGSYAMLYLFRLLVETAALGPTSVEVSAQPLFPGEQCLVYLTQAGQLKVDSLEVWLVCDEEVSFSDGTDTRSETRRVFRELVFRREDFEILPSEPFQYECALRVPPDAMHSFLSMHNAVIWKLVVCAAADKWPALERVFPMVVHPALHS